MARAAERGVRRQRGNRADARGVGLIEVLVAVAILAFGMLGIAALQSTALRNGQSALERNQAMIHSYGILDRMRANADRARIGEYDLAKTCTVPDAGDVVATDLHDWITNLHANLGDSACGTIKCNSKTCTVTVEWDDSRGTSGSAAQTLITETRL